MLLAIIKQELTISIKNASNLVQSLVFFLITISIFAITTNINDTNIAIAIIWICLTFAILLASNQQFQRDFDDGTFEQLYLSGYVFEIIILTKIFANWLFNTLPLIVILPIIALILKVPSNLFFDLIAISLISSLLINFMVSFASSLTLCANSSSCLLTILVLPLLVPIMIFANTAFNGDFAISIKLLLAIFIFLAPILTFGTSLAIKLGLVD
jgi:heme exporter protein B